MDIAWEDVNANLKHTEELLKGLEVSDIVVLPEMFSTAFSTSATQLAEPIDGPTIRAVSLWAKQYDSLFIGSFIAEENGKFYNRGFAVFPDGKKLFYDKRHLFLGGEEKFFTPGEKELIFNYHGWNINIAICYDLRFPVWLRNKNLKYDLLILVAEWPANRQYIFDNLLISRAIENQAYVCACNRIGKDGNFLSYTGGSTCIDFKGKIIGRLEDNKEEIKRFTIEKYPLESNREKAPVWKHAD